jgi:hypothetical protein
MKLVAEYYRIAILGELLKENRSAVDFDFLLTAEFGLVLHILGFNNDIQFLLTVGFPHHIHEVRAVRPACGGRDSNTATRNFAVHHDFLNIGKKIMLLKWRIVGKSIV